MDMTNEVDEFADERLGDIGIVVYWTGETWRFKPVDWGHSIPYSPAYPTRIDAIASAHAWHASYAWHVPDKRVARP